MMQKIKLSVRDLRKYLADQKISPEEFAKRSQLSHMTIRRWLKKGEHESLPSKYAPVLGPLFGKTPPPVLPKFSLANAMKDLNIDALMKEIEKSGSVFNDIAALEDALAKKLKGFSDKIFKDCCAKLIKAAKSPKSSPRAKAIARGALLYFVDPVGLPDDTPLIGYMAELTILSVALNRIDSL
jgi:uncharacterized membrane protein YkvA (DUF1232 family)